MKKIVLYGAGEIGRKYIYFLEKYDLEKYVLAFCDKNYKSIESIEHIPVKPYESFDNSTVFVISTVGGYDEIENLLKNDKKIYYPNLSSWILDSFEGEKREFLYFEYLNRKEEGIDYEKIEGTLRARRMLSSLKGECISSEKVIKIGTQYGGWVIPRDVSVNKDDYILCAGAGEDISFDCEMADKYECNVITLDPTPKAVKHFKKLQKAVKDGIEFYINNTDIPYNIRSESLEKIQYIVKGLARENKTQKFYFPSNEKHVSCSIKNLQATDKYFEAECLNYKTLLEELNIPKFKLVKIDVEGAEYEVIQSIIESKNMPEILCVDFDESNIALDLDAELRIENTINMLKKEGMKLIWIEGDSATFILEQCI